MDEPQPVDQPVAQGWRLGERGRRWFDIALATALLVPVIAMPVGGQPATWTVLCLVQLVPLYFRRRHPVPVFVVVALATAAQALLIDSPLWGQVAFPVATYSVARWRDVRWGIGAVVVGVAGAVVASVDWLRGVDGSVTFGNGVATFLTIATIVVAAWALGTLGRVRSAYVDALVERSRRIERETAQQVELAASEERARIAREMHDVVAHGLSVMVVQADGARYAAERDPDAATRTLATIAETGRDALAEMRRLLGLLAIRRRHRDPPAAAARRHRRAGRADAARPGTAVTPALPPPDRDRPDGVGAHGVPDRAGVAHQRPQARRPGREASRDGRDRATSSRSSVEDDGRGASSRRRRPGPRAGRHARAGRGARRHPDAGPRPRRRVPGVGEDPPVTTTLREP